MLQSIEASGVPMLMDVHPFFLYRWKCVCLWRCNRSCNWSSVRQAPTGPDDAFERSKAIRQCLGAPTQRDHPGAPWGGPSSWEVWKIWRIVKVAHTKYVINIYIYIYVIYVSYIYIYIILLYHIINIYIYIYVIYVSYIYIYYTIISYYNYIYIYTRDSYIYICSVI